MHTSSFQWFVSSLLSFLSSVDDLSSFLPQPLWVTLVWFHKCCILLCHVYAISWLRSQLNSSLYPPSKYSRIFLSSLGLVIRLWAGIGAWFIPNLTCSPFVDSQDATARSPTGAASTSGNTTTSTSTKNPASTSTTSSEPPSSSSTSLTSS